MTTDDGRGDVPAAAGVECVVRGHEGAGTGPAATWWRFPVPGGWLYYAELADQVSAGCTVHTGTCSRVRAVAGGVFVPDRSRDARQDHGPLDALGLPDRVRRALAYEGIRTIEDLTSMSAEEIVSLKNVGRVSLWEVERTLKRHGLALRGRHAERAGVAS